MIIEHGLIDGQVLQRRRNHTANATVRGTCSTTGKVQATIRPGNRQSHRRVGAARNGKFTAQLTGIPVGGPYEITLSVSNESVTAHRINVGDVWLLAGQSNMQGCGNLNSAPKPHPKVHAMYMDDRWDIAKEPIHFLAESPDPIHYETYGKEPLPKASRNRLLRDLKKGVGPGIFFGKEMVDRSGGVPQGLLCTAHGGTSMEQWDPAKKNLGGRSLYGSMLRTWRKAGQPVAGILWYQGESDCIDAAAPLYTERMKQFVAAVRRDLKQRDLPFLLAQIGKVFGSGWTVQPWNSVQIQQLKLKKQIKNYGVVATIDLPLDDMIHVGTEGCARLGVRLARLADRMVYGNRKELPAPEVASISTRPTAATKGICTFPIAVTFKNVGGGLRAAGLPTGFTLVDENHNDLRAVYKVTLKGNVAFLETNVTGNAEGFYLMYGCGTSPYANITDGRDLSIPVFLEPVIERTIALSPYIDRWMVSSIQPAETPIAKQAAPTSGSRLGLEQKLYEQSFVNEHAAWAGKQGQAYFFSEIKLSEPMRLNLRLGYDGPIKVWIDGKAVFSDPNGANPAVPDQGIVPVSLAKGKHKLSVAMDLHDGLAWGFFLRFNRRDVTKAALASGKLALPVCSLETA